MPSSDVDINPIQVRKERLIVISPIFHWKQLSQASWKVLLLDFKHCFQPSWASWLVGQLFLLETIMLLSILGSSRYQMGWNPPGVKAASRGLSEERQEVRETLLSKGRSPAHQVFKGALYSRAKVLRGSGKSLPLTAESGQWWMVSVHILIH